MDVLEDATKAGKLTAWKLDGKSMIDPPQPFMAISHVWSDGTGTGAWKQGEVNECLYNYFRGIAKRFQCEGIWWDTICIPKDKAARSIAINQIQSNYEDARITLVHDCFLREWEWFDAETACFAIIMSPWFSRGWTALELAKSHKVKVAFKSSIIKDLDEDILAKLGTGSDRHRIASELIANLRRGTITTINGLLTVLHSRYTSWPRDIALISGLLTGIKIEPDATQQKIYQDILKNVGNVSHGQLFHNSTTMSIGFSWCPISLLDMQVSPTEPTLRVYGNGDVTGPWKIIRGIRQIREEKYNWKDVHPLIEVRLRSALQDPDNHLLLAEPEATDKAGADPRAMSKTGSVTRALLVKPVETDALRKFQLVGSVYFHPPLTRQEIGEQSEGPMDITIGDAEESKKTPDQGQTHHRDHVKSNEQLLLASRAGDEEAVRRLLDSGCDLNFRDERTWTALHYASWRCHDRVVEKLINSSDYAEQDRLGQHAIHLASERGNETIVSLLLRQGADPNVQCEHKQTALHRAAWADSTEVIQLLLLAYADPNIQDSQGQTALHLATQYGYEAVAKLLMEKSDRNIQDSKGQTALHLALQYGRKEVAELLVKGGSNVDVPDCQGCRPLHLAAKAGNDKVVQLLLDTGAEVDTPNLMDGGHCT